MDNTIRLLNDLPASVEDIIEQWIAVGMPLDNPARPKDLQLVTDYLDDWTRLVDAPDEGERVRILNLMLTRYASAPTVTDHDGSGWHIHYRPEMASLGEILTASTTVAAADHLTAHGMHRLGRCALPECGNAFADHSRPGQQRYCSHPCANRDAVRRHRHNKTDSPLVQR